MSRQLRQPSRQGARPPELPVRRSVYVAMRDGVRLAVDVTVPAGRGEGQRVAAIVVFSRYWRSYRRSGPDPALDGDGFSEVRAFTGRGFAHVAVDVRGTGASFGSRSVEYPPEEIDDYGEIFDWIIRQPWSNGRVATTGVSYLGNSAELAAIPGHPALRAAVPRFNDFDWYQFILFPGGLRNISFGDAWGHYIRALDRGDPAPLVAGGMADVEGVRPVEDDPERRLLAAALQEHAANFPFAELIDRVVFRDDLPGGAEKVGSTSNVCELEREICAARVPMWHWAGWLDSGTASGALARFATFDTPMVVSIGPWNHGAIGLADPFADPAEPVRPSVAEQVEQIADFVRPFLTGSGEARSIERAIHYYTLGTGVWRQAASWPPAGIEMVRWYFREGGRLAPEPPTEADGADRYAVDFAATTGTETRWATSMGGTPVRYPDRAEQDRRLLTYTSTPMREDTEITGHPVVTLHVVSSHTDGAFIVYLEDVAPDGRVTYITEGHLRAIHRAASAEQPPFQTFGPYHTFLRRHAQPLAPGEVATLEFTLLATSALIRRGHAIRIAVAGADRDNFARIPETGDPTVRVLRTEGWASGVLLPMRRWPG